MSLLVRRTLELDADPSTEAVSFELVQGPYRARLARTPEDLDRAFALRFATFNVELGEGLAESWLSGRDRDAFDAQCDHLLVELRSSGAVIGTYRMQTAKAALCGRGFYCDVEFDLGDLPPEVLASSVELGRACIAPEHRQRHVLFLLWRGLGAYMRAHRTRYFFGCCSLRGNDPVAAAAAFQWLSRRGHVHPEIRVRARPEHAFPTPGPPAPSPAGARPVELPALFRTYLRHGARICSGPACDRAFGTTDFLTLLDVDDLEPRYLAAFAGGLA
jgi:putative hemolysin